MKRFRTFLLLVFVSLVVTFSFQITEMFSEKAIPSENARIQDEVDYSIENFSLAILDKSGKMQYHVNAISILHYKESDLTRLEGPHIELFRSPQEHWKIEAKCSNVSPGGKEVVLDGGVQIRRTTNDKQKPFIITTETLNINPDDNTISTQDNIQLQGNGISIKAKGMFANLGQETFQLLSGVRGSYVSPQ